jgi:hypothetical protein
VKGVRKPPAAKKPPKIPRAAPPTPLPKPTPLPVTPTQAKSQQSTQNNQLAQAIAKNMTKQQPQPHPGAPKPVPGNIISPIDLTRPREPWEKEMPKNRSNRPSQSALPVR